jgi:hypothetical protein
MILQLQYNKGKEMLSFLKKLFGFGSTPAPEAPYKVEVTQQGIVAVGEPPATVVIPVAGLMLPVEGAGAVEVAPVKKPRAKKPASEKKPAAEKKPRAKKAPKAE